MIAISQTLPQTSTDTTKSSVLLAARNLRKYYYVKKSWLGNNDGVVKALDDISFKLEAGKTLAVVGESGCGKSTLAKLLTMIETPTDGEVDIDGYKIDPGVKPSRELRCKIQIVFQNPFASLNPRQTIGAALQEPLFINLQMTKAERHDAAMAMMLKVGLRPEHFSRYPHMFSGGQRQRIAIARALMLRPKILILDEPVSALDISIQAQVLNLLTELQQEFDLAYLFISHDLSVVRHIADDIMVMYLGKTVEYGPAKKVFANPIHPYTQALLSATPSTRSAEHKKQRIILTGELPSPLAPPSGCYFHPRCFKASPACEQEQPQREDIDGRQIYCLHGREINQENKRNNENNN